MSKAKAPPLDKPLRGTPGPKPVLRQPVRVTLFMEQEQLERVNTRAGGRKHRSRGIRELVALGLNHGPG